MNLLGSFVIAFSMYSKIPMPQVEWTKERMRYAMCFFPLIGAVIGGLLLLFSAICEMAGLGKVFYVCVGTVLPLIVTGGIHMDGFLDVTDARSSYRSREEKLRILKDPHTGAFAIIGFGIYLFLYAGAFSELNFRFLSLFAGSFVLTRALSGLSVVSFPMAKKDGLAAEFSQSAVKRTVRMVMFLYIAASAGFMLWTNAFAGSICLAGASLVFGLYYRMSKKEFGGITGDLAGYFLQNCELVILILAAVCGRNL